MRLKIILIRHGKTKDEKLLTEKFIPIASDIAKFISLEKNCDDIYFVSSPLDRCVESIEIIISEVNKLLNTEYKNNTDIKLSRWEKGQESREDSYIRALEYRKQIKKIKKPLIVLLSHSSMLPKLTYGFVNKKIKYDNFKKNIKNNDKLEHGYISVVDFDKDFKYNFKC